VNDDRHRNQPVRGFEQGRLLDHTIPPSNLDAMRRRPKMSRVVSVRWM
jgi:hypothetical protein